MHINNKQMNKPEKPASLNQRYLPGFSFAVFVSLILMMLGLVQSANADYQIGSDDSLQIKVYGYDDLTIEPRVSGSGRITFPLIGEISVAGLTTFDVEQKIARLLASGSFIKNPHVTVTILDNQGQLVSVLGQVNKPGRYPLQTSSNLIDMIAMAGGINEAGDDRAIITSRVDGKLFKKEINLRDALELPGEGPVLKVEKGDILFIPKAPVFYIYGQVQKPGAYRLDPNMSVAQAISLAGGLTLRGTLRGTVIERRNKDGKQDTIDVELTDPVYKEDVVVVDERWF